VGGDENVEVADSEVEAMMAEIDTDHDGKVAFDEFQSFYLKSRKRYEVEFTKMLAAHGVGNTLSQQQFEELMVAIEEEIGLDVDIERVEADLEIPEGGHGAPPPPPPKQPNSRLGDLRGWARFLFSDSVLQHPCYLEFADLAGLETRGIRVI
jgi:hypothetical protein